MHKVWKFLKDLNFEPPCNLRFPELKEAMRRRNHVLIFVNLEIRVFGVLNKLNKIMYLQVVVEVKISRRRLWVCGINRK